MSSEAKSRESVLLDPIDDTLNQVEDIPYTQILKEPTTKRKRGKAICYELHSSFNDFTEIKLKHLKKLTQKCLKKGFYCPNGCTKKNSYDLIELANCLLIFLMLKPDYRTHIFHQNSYHNILNYPNIVLIQKKKSNCTKHPSLASKDAQNRLKNNKSPFRTKFYALSRAIETLALWLSNQKPAFPAPTTFLVQLFVFFQIMENLMKMKMV
ncbi:hypothetical protein BpHYR1_039042 [Brachionus plicatilis]|uniref:Uncharacterized protein n=1 Tax=Brachionus plicatilis TaxID=10195 RepID=A0A3M7R4L8_BRAPC|nr:hypothetical protein BpHYR1_039042 [Brachionus plicatilis]